MKPRALLSVTDKTGLVDFARGLSALGFDLLSTGGTAKALREAGMKVTDVAEVTGFPEMLDGRVKTLHPKIHGALLGDRSNESHLAQMAEAGISPIDLVCINLYAFEQTVREPHTLKQAIESIDIGGPAMIRAASKNGLHVTVVVDPQDYDRVLFAIESGKVEEMRPELMAKAFRLTAYYDSMISRYLTRVAGVQDYPSELTFGFRRSLTMRYGENPHQMAALYRDPMSHPGLGESEILWGKELSYNNILDGDAAWELVCDLPEGSCAIIKHGNPCGAATHEDLGEAYRLARKADEVSAYGGIAAFNRPIDKAAAEAMTEKGNFLEMIIGPEVEDEALEIIKARSGWGQYVRVLKAPVPPSSIELSLRTVRGGVLVQTTDEELAADWRVATERVPSEGEWESLRFLWSVVKHVKSNAIVVGKGNRLLGVGAGQMNRVRSVRLAIEQAADEVSGAALASDAFFPFPDSIEEAAKHGITAVIQPGGSKQDPAVISKANELGIAMVLTGVRHFRH